MSIHAVPGRMASRSPSGPSTTARTWGGPGSEVTTASASAAAAAGVCAHDRALLDDPRRALADDVVNGDLEALVEQVVDHRLAHVADADEADVHGCLLLHSRSAPALRTRDHTWGLLHCLHSS